MTIYRGLQAAQQAYQSQRENLAREARAFHTMESTGVGAVIDPDKFVFPNPFVFKPAVAYGAEVITLPDQSVWGLPRPTGAVMRWDVNDRGFFIGAYVYVVVDLDPLQGTPPTLPVIKLDHYFQFSGLAYKDLGETAMAQVAQPDIPPNIVNL